MIKELYSSRQLDIYPHLNCDRGTKKVNHTLMNTKPSLMQRLAAAVQDQMEKKLTAARMASYELAASLDPLLEERVYDVACRVALDLASTLHISNFHFWEFFRGLKTIEEARQRALDLQSDTHPFATCLDMAMATSSALKAALLRDPDLADYACRVETVTDCKPDIIITSPRDIHCLTLLRFHDFCIVIDLCAQPTAFKVHLDTAFQCQQQLDLLAQDFHSFAYAYVGNANGARMLVDCSGYKTKTPYDLFFGLSPFHSITDVEISSFLAFALAANFGSRLTCIGNMPSRRTVQARSIWTYAPKSRNITYTPLSDDTFIVDTLALRIDFVKQELHLAIPYKDWLVKPANAFWLERMSGYTEFERCAYHLSDAVAFFKLSLGTNVLFDLPIKGINAQVLCRVRLMDDVCARLGLPEGEVLRIAHVVRDVWVEALRERNEEMELCLGLLQSRL